MRHELEDIDPAWAWAPFGPSDEQPWDLRLVTHLFRRAGLAAGLAQVDQALESDPQAIVAEMVERSRLAATTDQPGDELSRTILASGDSRRLSAAWLYRFLNAPEQLLEKMTLFWHGHFATGAEKVNDARMMWDQNTLLRKHAVGYFPELVHGIARDPAMLVYLDSVSNRKSHPNENFARELMELFCLGEGHYSERDVQELARCFTGWEIRSRRFRKNRYQQDRGTKSLLGQSGPFDGEDGIEIVLRQPAMPQFICQKLVKFLVCDEPPLSPRLLAPLVSEFREQGFQLAPLLQRILGSNLFFSRHSLARKIRSPIELVGGLLRALGGTTNVVEMATGLAGIGQGLFFPPNVKGWDGGRDWINSSTLLGRANLVQRTLSSPKTRFQGAGLAESLEQQGASSPDEVVQWLLERLLATPIDQDQRAILLSELTGGTGDREQRTRNTLHLLSTFPEFQLG